MSGTFSTRRVLNHTKGVDMKAKNKGNEENEHDLADLEAFRTGEGMNVSEETRNSDKAKEALDDLVSIAETFKGHRPDPDDIPEAVDQAILSHIRGRAHEIRRQRKVIHLFPRRAWAAAAVVALAVFVVTWNLFTPFKNPKELPMTALNLETIDSSKDVDGNGSVDIIDAYLMARRVKDGVRLPAEWDFDQNGAIDQGDIRSLAMAAVALNQGDV